MYFPLFTTARVFLAFGLACIASSIFAQDAAEKIAVPERLDVYLLIGQSNMAGRAPYSEEDAQVIPGCFLLNAEDQWEPAKNPLNAYSTIRKPISMQKMNPGYMFARTMLAKTKDAPIGLVVNAKGGTKIEQWEKGTHFYKEAVRRTKIAVQSGTLKGILWHQGEANKDDPDYLTKLAKLISDLRTDLDVPNLPFIAGQINNIPLMNDQIAKLPETVPNTGFASSQGLKAMDQWHFDSESMKLLGTRYAEAMLKVQQANEKPKSSGQQ